METTLPKENIKWIDNPLGDGEVIIKSKRNKKTKKEPTTR